MLRKTNLMGQRFGRLMVIEEAERSKTNQIRWLCKCDCGGFTISFGTGLTRGRSKSCGCLHKENMSKKFKKHGCSRGGPYKSEFNTWSILDSKCYNENYKQYKDYGGRGIKVCKRWRKSFSNFLKDMGPRPSKIHSLDRIDNDGDYKPSNCRWATPSQQSRNRRGLHWIEYKEERMIVTDWATVFGISPQSLFEKLKKFTFEEIYLFYKE
jgi:hypothetical protein